MGATVEVDGMKFEKTGWDAVEAAFDSKPVKVKTVVDKSNPIKTKKKDNTMKIEKMSLRGAQWYVVRTFVVRYREQLICAGLALAIGIMLGVKI